MDKRMLIKTLTVGQIETNCYIVTDETTLECVVIDPGDESNAILGYLEEQHLKCRFILLTHGHYDHTLAAAAVTAETGAPICINRADTDTDAVSPYAFAPAPGTIFCSDGDVFKAGRLEFRVMETPGHSPGSITFICEDAVFSGDTLFKDSCGRADLPGGDMQTLLNSLLRIYLLEGNYEVYPGHMDSSTLERERRFNYYMKYAHDNSNRN